MIEPQEPKEGAFITVPSTAITGVNGMHLEPRCRVCRNDQARTKVNGLLATRSITRWGPWMPLIRSTNQPNSPMLMTTMTTCNQSRVRQRATPVHCLPKRCAN